MDGTVLGGHVAYTKGGLRDENGTKEVLFRIRRKGRVGTGRMKVELPLGYVRIRSTNAPRCFVATVCRFLL